MMKVLPSLSVAVALVVVSAHSLALAQTLPSAWQGRPGAPAIDAQRYRADQNRLEMERLRLGTHQRRLEAQLGRMEAQIARDRIVSARQSEPMRSASLVALHTSEQERAARQAAEQRRQADASTVSQIDAWLDRPIP